MLFASVCFGVIELFLNSKFIFLFLGALTFGITLILFTRLKEVRVRFKNLRIVQFFGGHESK